MAAAAIDRFEAFLKRCSFKTFHRECAVAFKRHLAQEESAVTGQLLSRSTVDSTLRVLVTFFKWLADQPGFRSKFSYSDAEHFNLPLADARAGRPKRVRGFPTLDQVHAVLAKMPARTDIEKRDQALVALTLLTGRAGRGASRPAPEAPPAGQTPARSGSARSPHQVFQADYNLVLPGRR